MNNDKQNDAVVLGTLKKEKKGKPFLVLIIFALLIGTCYFLPNINIYLDNNDNSFTRFINQNIRPFIDKNYVYQDNNDADNTAPIVNEQKKIICSLDGDEYIYNFINNNLDNLSHKYMMKFEDEQTYMTGLNKYKQMADYYSKLDGIISSVEENDSGFTFDLSMNLKKIMPSKFSSYQNDNYFNYKTTLEYVTNTMKDRKFDCK